MQQQKKLVVYDIDFDFASVVYPFPFVTAIFLDIFLGGYIFWINIGKERLNFKNSLLLPLLLMSLDHFPGLIFILPVSITPFSLRIEVMN